MKIFFQKKSILIIILVLLSLSIANSQVNIQDSLALVSLYNSTDGANWGDTDGVHSGRQRWDLSQPISSWGGVEVYSKNYRIRRLRGRVSELSLDYFNLSGELPSLAQLDELKSLGLEGNNLNGNIPADIGSLTKLTRLQLTRNNFSGSIPESIGQLTNMEYMSLAYNQLSGSIPASIANMDRIRRLVLANNKLSGSVPNEIASMNSLRDLDLHNNELTDLPDLSSLYYRIDLRVANNHFDFADLVPSQSRLSAPSDYSPQFSLIEEEEHHIMNGQTFVLSIPEEIGYQYQWYKGDDPIDGATESDFSISRSTVSEDEIYYCQVSHTDLPGLTLQYKTTRFTAETSLRAQDSLALVSLYNSTDGANWGDTDGVHSGRQRWDLSQPISTWGGVEVYSENYRIRRLRGRVSELSLDYFNLSGELPSLAQLDELKSLDLEGNNLNGNIPADIGSLTKLTRLQLTRNNFSGSIPESIGQLTNMEYMSLAYNQLSGFIPASIANMNRIRRLVLANNKLSGSVPNEIASMNSLRDLDLHNNELTDLPDLSSLYYRIDLRVANNHFDFADLVPSRSRLSDPSDYSPQFPVIEEEEHHITTGQTFVLSVPEEVGYQYQWYKGDDPIDGATESDFSVSSSTASEDEIYYCQVSHTDLPGLTLRYKTTRFTVEISLRAQDSLALVSLYNSANGSDWTNTWNFNQPMDHWHGVTVNNGRVRRIDLRNNNLSRVVPEDIINLTEIRKFYLSNNRLTHLPDLSSLPFLNDLRIRKNSFDFDDIRPNIDKFIRRYYYLSQKRLGRNERHDVEPNSTVTLSVEREVGDAYQWFFRKREIEGATNPTLTLENIDESNEGIYACRVRDTRVPGLTLFSGRDTISLVVVPIPQEDNDLSDQEEMTADGDDVFNVTVYPNPAVDHINISINGSSVGSTIYYRIYNSYGNSVLEGTFSATVVEHRQSSYSRNIELNNINEGLYILEVVSDTGDERRIELIITGE